MGLWSEHQDFATKYQNDMADSSQVTEEQEAELTASEFVDGYFDTPF